MRGIPASERLQASVEGDVAEVEDVLRITSIRLAYRLRAPAGMTEKIDRALASHGAVKRPSQR